MSALAHCCTISVVRELVTQRGRCAMYQYVVTPPRCCHSYAFPCYSSSPPPTARAPPSSMSRRHLGQRGAKILTTCKADMSTPPARPSSAPQRHGFRLDWPVYLYGHQVPHMHERVSVPSDQMHTPRHAYLQIRRYHHLITAPSRTQCTPTACPSGSCSWRVTSYRGMHNFAPLARSAQVKLLRIAFFLGSSFLGSMGPSSGSLPSLRA